MVLSLTSLAAQIGLGSGPPATRRIGIIAGVAGAVLATFIGVALYRAHSVAPTSTTLETVPQTQTGTGFSGSNQERRSMLQEQEAAAADQAHLTGQSQMMSPEMSHPTAREVRHSAAIRTGPYVPQSPSVVPNDDMTRGYLIALNEAMAAMGPGFEMNENLDERAMEKERAAERAASQKAAVPTDKADDSGKAGKRGIPQGLAGRLVAARTVLADKMEADTGVPPAVVEMVTGPLAGYRLQGNIQKHDSSLTVMMDTLFYNGQQIPVKALLISPETQEATVASSVDHQYLARIGIPALVGGAQGLGQAAQQSGSSFAAGPYGGAASYSQFSPWQIAGTMAGGAAQGVASTLHSVLPQGSIVTLKADEMVNVYFQDEVYLPPQ